MRQLFFISPTGYPAVKKAFEEHVNGVQQTHGWCAEGDDPKTQTVIGVVEMDGHCDAEVVIDRLESVGIMWLPNHHGNENIKPEHAQALKHHGVVPSDTTLQAMNKVHAVAGFPPIKPKRF